VVTPAPPPIRRNQALIPDVSNQQGIEDKSTRVRVRKQRTWKRNNRSRHHGWFLEEEEEQLFSYNHIR
jgi:hypothetical protein